MNTTYPPPARILARCSGCGELLEVSPAYGSQGDGRGRENAAREVIWFSPACRSAAQQSLFALPLAEVHCG